jgi:hypothetical protein
VILALLLSGLQCAVALLSKSDALQSINEQTGWGLEKAEENELIHEETDFVAELEDDASEQVHENGKGWQYLPFRMLLKQSEVENMKQSHGRVNYACGTMPAVGGAYLPKRGYFLAQNKSAAKNLHDAFNSCLCSLPSGEKAWQPGDGTDPLGTALLWYIDQEGSCAEPANAWRYVTQCHKYLRVSSTAKWNFASGLQTCNGKADGRWSCLFESDRAKLCGANVAAAAHSLTCRDFKLWLNRYCSVCVPTSMYVGCGFLGLY